MKRLFILLVLNFLLLSCSTTQPLTSLNTYQFILDPSQYSTEKGRSLARSHHENTNNIFNNINEKYEGISFTPVTKSEDGKFTGGIGFFREEIRNSIKDHRYLGISISTADIFYLENDSSKNRTLRVETIYTKYIRELLKIMTDEKEILADDDVEGFSIKIAWVNKLGSIYVDDFIVRASKSDAYDYSHNLMTAQDFLSNNDVLQFGKNMSMEKVNVNIASLSKSSVVHVSPLSESSIAGTLDKDSEVIIHSYEKGFFGFPDHSAFVSKENFIITGFLRSLIGKYEPEIADKKNELESEKQWVKSSVVNVRESNTTSSPVIGKLRRGDYVFIQEERNNWYRVYYSEPGDSTQFKTVSELIAAYKKGWIYKKLLSSIRIDRLPVDKQPSVPDVVDAQTGNIEENKLEPEIADIKNKLESEKQWVKAIAVNVRESNTTSSPVIGKLRRGDYVFIQEERNNWYRVYYSEPGDSTQFKTVSELIAAYKKGWIYKKLLSSIRIDRLPVDKQPSVPDVVDAQTGNVEYYIQVGAWKSPDYAEAMLLKFRQYYPETYITVENNFHKVRIPGIMNKKQGADISKDLEREFSVKPIVVRKIK